MEPLLNFLTADLHNAQLVTGPPQSTVAIDRPTPRFPHIQGGGKSTSPSIADFPVDLVVWFVSKIVRMVRKARIEYAGAYYHVINRGNYRSWIFESDEENPGVSPSIHDFR